MQLMNNLLGQSDEMNSGLRICCSRLEIAPKQEMHAWKIVCHTGFGRSESETEEIFDV